MPRREGGEAEASEPTGIRTLGRPSYPLEPGLVSGCLSSEVPGTRPSPWTTMPALLQLPRPGSVPTSLRKPAPPQAWVTPAIPGYPAGPLTHDGDSTHALCQGFGKRTQQGSQLLPGTRTGGGVAGAEVVLICCMG